MKIREHRGGFEESMATAFEVFNVDDLYNEIGARLGQSLGYEIPIVPTVEFIHIGLDERNGWDTYQLFLRGYGVFGYSDHNPMEPLQSKYSRQLAETTPLLWTFSK